MPSVAVPAYFAAVRFAAATTFSTVKPKCFSSTPTGAEAPKPHMPMNWPLRPMYRSQPCLTPSSTATRRVTLGGKHRVAILGRLGVEQFPARHADHAGLDALGRELFVGRHAERHLAAGADQNHVGLAVGGVGQHVAAALQPGGRGVLRRGRASAGSAASAPARPADSSAA